MTDQAHGQCVQSRVASIIAQARKVYENHKGDGAWLAMERAYYDLIIAALNRPSLPAPGREEIADWEDPKVQIVYEMLCDDIRPPNPEEHWEGYLARRIVAALSRPENVDHRATEPASAPTGHPAVENAANPDGECGNG